MLNKLTAQSKKRHLFINNPAFVYYNIKWLPPQLQNYIYIWYMKLFWRDFVPITAKVPSWYPHALIQKDLLFYAQQENIHFLHLSCNTLEENKKYIMGCQCKFCLHDVPENYKRLLRDKGSSDGFYNTIPYTDSKWNNNFEYIYDDKTDSMTRGYTIFNPSYDISIITLDTINDVPIHFTASS